MKLHLKDITNLESNTESIPEQEKKLNLVYISDHTHELARDRNVRDFICSSSAQTETDYSNVLAIKEET